MKMITNLLKEQKFFDGFKNEWVELLAGCGQNIHIKKGEFVFREGENADNFYLVRQGKIHLETFVPGNPPAVFQTVSVGEILGWSWIFPPYKCAYDARVVEDMNAVMFDGKCLRNKCESNTELGYGFMKRFSRIIVDRLTAMQLQVADIYGRL